LTNMPPCTDAPEFSPEQRAFLESNHAAVMVTLRRDGTPHAVRVGVALVDGKLWSSGVPSRLRTRHLRRDPRSTLTVMSSGYGHLTVEATVTILDGPDAAQQSVQLFRTMQSRTTGPITWNGQPLEEPDFLDAMRREERLIYQFDPHRIYGMV
jgi:PPOX class probable F420-dependent enzyme